MLHFLLYEMLSTIFRTRGLSVLLYVTFDLTFASGATKIERSIKAWATINYC